MYGTEGMSPAGTPEKGGHVSTVLCALLPDLLGATLGSVMTGWQPQVLSRPPVEHNNSIAGTAGVFKGAVPDLHSCRMCDLVFADAASRNCHEVTHFYTTNKKRRRLEDRTCRRRKRQCTEQETSVTVSKTVYHNADNSRMTSSSKRKRVLAWKQVPSQPNVCEDTEIQRRSVASVCEDIGTQPRSAPNSQSAQSTSYTGPLSCFTCSCPECGIRFALGSSLQKHIQRAHLSPRQTGTESKEPVLLAASALDAGCSLTRPLPHLVKGKQMARDESKLAIGVDKLGLRTTVSYDLSALVPHQKLMPGDNTVMDLSMSGGTRDRPKGHPARSRTTAGLVHCNPWEENKPGLNLVTPNEMWTAVDETYMLPPYTVTPASAPSPPPAASSLPSTSTTGSVHMAETNNTQPRCETHVSRRVTRLSDVSRPVTYLTDVTRPVTCPTGIKPPGPRLAARNSLSASVIFNCTSKSRTQASTGEDNPDVIVSAQKTMAMKTANNQSFPSENVDTETFFDMSLHGMDQGIVRAATKDAGLDVTSFYPSAAATENENCIGRLHKQRM